MLIITVASQCLDAIDDRFEFNKNYLNKFQENYLFHLNQAKNALNFTGKVALVTGSSSGIGAETVRLFSFLGAQVVVTGRNRTRISQVAQQFYQLSPNRLRVIIFNYFKRFLFFDILLNVAGIFKSARLVDANFSRVFEEVTAINEIAVLQVSQQAIPYLLKTNGTIVNIASTAAKYPVYLAF